MSDEEDEVEPTDPDVAAYYLRRAKRSRMVGLIGMSVVLVACVLGAIWGANLLGFRGAVWFIGLGVACLGFLVGNILYVRRHPLE